MRYQHIILVKPQTARQRCTGDLPQIASDPHELRESHLDTSRRLQSPQRSANRPELCGPTGRSHHETMAGAGFLRHLIRLGAHPQPPRQRRRPAPGISDDPRLRTSTDLLKEHVGSPSMRHIRDYKQIHKLAMQTDASASRTSSTYPSRTRIDVRPARS